MIRLAGTILLGIGVVMLMISFFPSLAAVLRNDASALGAMSSGEQVAAVISASAYFFSRGVAACLGGGFLRLVAR